MNHSEQSTYDIIVPAIKYGESYPIQFEEETIYITCLDDVEEDFILSLKIPSMNSTTLSNQSNLQLQSIDSNQSKINYAMILWIILEIINFVIIILSLQLKPFETQRISNSCNIINLKTNHSLKSIYYYIFGGISSSSYVCENTSQDFW